MSEIAPPDAATAVAGTLHIFVAFDWGDEIDLEQARRLVPAAPHELPRRRRAPPSYSYRPAPLYMTLPATRLALAGLGEVEAVSCMTLFDFAAVSVGFRVPFERTPAQLLKLAASLSDPTVVVQAARAALAPLFEALRPALKDPSWRDDFSEEYFVFQLAAGALPWCAHAEWLAGMVHLDDGPLSEEERQEALRLRISYSPDDLFVPDWAAAVLIDHDCDEALQAIEFANLQLLELRHIDQRLDARLTAAQRLIAPLVQKMLPFWRMFDRPLRALGELKMEANDLFERTGNVLKLVGDPYPARLYRLVAQRFHLAAWEESIRRKLETTEGVYQVISDQASTYRMEFLEIVIVLLILFEIVMAFVR